MLLYSIRAVVHLYKAVYMFYKADLYVVQVEREQREGAGASGRTCGYTANFRFIFGLTFSPLPIIQNKTCQNKSKQYHGTFVFLLYLIAEKSSFKNKIETHDETDEPILIS